MRSCIQWVRLAREAQKNLLARVEQVRQAAAERASRISAAVAKAKALKHRAQLKTILNCSD